MPQLTLVPFNTQHPITGFTEWVPLGTPALVLKADGDANRSQCTITIGKADSDPIRGNQWLTPGGSLPNWAGRTITNLRLDFNVTPLDASGIMYFALVSANEPLTYVETIYDGALVGTVNVPQWFTIFNGMNSNMRAAIIANNFLFSAIFYNHSNPSLSVVAEAARMVIDYQDPVYTAGIAMEI